MTRIWITGSSGVGKSTLAQSLSARLDVPYIELDALQHGPHWKQMDPNEFRTVVSEAVNQPDWIVDGNYSSVLGTIVAERADLRIALDLPTVQVMFRVVRRTLRRTLTRQELWNGNREPLATLTRWKDPLENIILWTWTNRAQYHRSALAAEQSGRSGGPACVRLTSPAQVRRFADYLSG